MINVFSANYNGFTVTVKGRPVNVPILGEGRGPSSGYLIISDKEAVYLPRTTPDVKKLIGEVEDLVQTLSQTISIIQTGILNANTGGLIKQPTFDAEITEKKIVLTKQLAEIKAFKEKLK